MSLTLHVDGPRWRAHLRRTLDARPELVPVAKGNGYGFGNARLAAASETLGVRAMAVGTYPEVAEVAGEFGGDILVLTPWRASETIGPMPVERLIHTISRVEDLLALSTDPEPEAPLRIVLERATSMRRHGMSARELREAATVVRERPAFQVEGVALHLPLGARGNLGEVERLMQDVVAAELSAHPAGRTVWVSHLTETELSALSSHWPDVRFRPRVGTGLWLGERAALRATATVLDVHAVKRGDVYGYRGRTAPRAGTILVVSGGTAHGIGLEAPIGELTWRSRAATFARGSRDAAGLVRSPASAKAPSVGEEIVVRCRFTITDFDGVDLSGVDLA